MPNTGQEEYIDRLAKLQNILAECDSTCVAVVGDYNANVLKNANFAVLLKEYCCQFKYKWSSCLKLPEGTHTYVSDAWGSHSWLDHIISTEDGNNVITNMYVPVADSGRGPRGPGPPPPSGK